MNLDMEKKLTFKLQIWWAADYIQERASRGGLPRGPLKPGLNEKKAADAKRTLVWDRLIHTRFEKTRHVRSCRGALLAFVDEMGAPQ